MFACFSLTEMFQLSVQLTSDLRITMKISDLAVQIQNKELEARGWLTVEEWRTRVRRWRAEDEGASMAD